MSDGIWGVPFDVVLKGLGMAGRAIGAISSGVWEVFKYRHPRSTPPQKAEQLETISPNPIRPTSTIQVYFVPEHKRFDNLRVILSKHEEMNLFKEDDAYRMWGWFQRHQMDYDGRYVIFIDLYQSMERKDIKNALDLIRDVRAAGRHIAFKPLFVFFSDEVELKEVFQFLRKSKWLTKFDCDRLENNYWRFYSDTAAAELNTRLDHLYEKKIKPEWGPNGNPKSSDSPY
jgi:hypothetical protein